MVESERKEKFEHALQLRMVLVIEHGGDRRVDEATVSEVLNLEVAYCGLLLRWALCCFQTGADLIPVNVELAPPEDVYDVFALTSMPAVQAWGPSNPVGLCEIVAEIRGTLSAHHRQKIEAHPNRGVAFNFDAITSRRR